MYLVTKWSIFCLQKKQYKYLHAYMFNEKDTHVDHIIVSNRREGGFVARTTNHPPGGVNNSFQF